MYARPAPLKIPALLAAMVTLLLTMGGISSPATAATAPAAAAASNGVDRAANLVSRDKWARTEPAFGHSSSSDDEDDDDDDDTASTAKPHPVEHKGELNGDLKLKAW